MECGFLTDSSTPQSRDETGKPTWFCKCGKFKTNEWKQLELHVEGEDSFFYPILFTLSAASIVYWYFDYSWKAALIFIVGFFIVAFIINQVMDRIEEAQQKKNKPRQPPQKTFFFQRVTFREEHEKHIKENAADYDPADPQLESLRRFRIISAKSECLFAKKAKVWGSCDWDENLTLEENVLRSLEMLRIGLKTGREIKLDGFLFEVRGNEYGKDITTFGETVRRVLQVISDNDPNCEHCMDDERIDKRGWRYFFDDEPIFVTCFGPCYPAHNARYTYGDTESSYVLIQPMFSFGLNHDIGPDHVWDDTKTTMRQKIRQNFLRAGRKYFVPPTRFYPMAPMIVPPIEIDEPLSTWYLKPNPRPPVHTAQQIEEKKRLNKENEQKLEIEDKKKQ